MSDEMFGTEAQEPEKLAGGICEAMQTEIVNHQQVDPHKLIDPPGALSMAGKRDGQLPKLTRRPAYSIPALVPCLPDERPAGPAAPVGPVRALVQDRDPKPQGRGPAAHQFPVLIGWQQVSHRVSIPAGEFHPSALPDLPPAGCRLLVKIPLGLQGLGVAGVADRDVLDLSQIAAASRAVLRVEYP